MKEENEIAPDGVNEKPRRPATLMEWIISGLFLIVVLKFGYTTLVVVGLIATMGVLLIGAVLKSENRDEVGKNFLAKIQDNNWVFYTMFFLTVASVIFWLLGLSGAPLPEMNPLKYVWGEIKDTVAPPPINPWANDGWSFTRLFLGNEGGWGGAALSFFFFTIVAYPVSFWDDWKDGWRKRAEKGVKRHWVVRIAKFLLEDLLSEEFWRFLGVFKK